MSSKHSPLPTSVERSDEQSAAPVLRLARWLVCPLCFILLQWTLLVAPSAVLPRVPALWDVPSNVSLEASLPPRPKSMLAAFALGRQVEAYEALGCGPNGSSSGGSSSGGGGGGGSGSSNSGRQLRSRRQSPPDTTSEASPCDRIRARAGASLDAPPLTALQMASAPRMIEDSLTLSARVFGLLNFVNFIWLVAVAGALCTVGPCVVYLFGDVMKRLARAVFDHAVLPLHRAGAFEVAAYVAAAPPDGAGVPLPGLARGRRGDGRAERRRRAAPVLGLLDVALRAGARHQQSCGEWRWW